MTDMPAERLTEGEAAAFGRRLDAFAAALTPRERSFLTEILREAETVHHDGTDTRTPGDIAVALHRLYRVPAISLNPQPLPPGLMRRHGE
jgi:hypothetical protein